MRALRRLGVLLILALAPAVAAQQNVPPAAAPPRPLSLPQISEKTLPNGLRIIVVPKRDVPLVSARLLVRSGSEQDPAAAAGLASLTAALLTQGTKSRSAEQIARGVEALGGTLQTAAGWDASAVEITVLASNIGPALGFVADVVRNPTFRPDEVERLRTQSVDAVLVSLQEPQTLARYVAARVLYGDTPYGRSVSGTPESLRAITREQITGFHARHYHPENAVLILAGDIVPEAAFAAGAKHFGSWRRREGGMVRVELRTPGEPPKPRVVVVDVPDAGQAAVIVTRKGIPRVSPNYFPALVVNSVLGGGYSARLNQEIRIRRGLSYGASSAFEPRREAGPFIASTQTKNESAAEVASLILEQLDGLAKDEIGSDELTPRKAVLTGAFARSLETTAGIVERVAALALYGLPLEEIARFTAGVEAVSAEQIRAFARSHLGGAGASVVIVGDARQFLEPLRGRFSNLEVIPVADLDLNAATLR